jgi:vacuolar-type H+-ATPase subunit I/STV1
MIERDGSIGTYQTETAEALRALSSRLQAAEARVENSEADLRIKNQEGVDNLGWRLKEIETKLDDLTNANESEREARQLEIDSAISQLSQEIENAITLLGG